MVITVSFPLASVSRSTWVSTTGLSTGIGRSWSTSSSIKTISSSSSAAATAASGLLVVTTEGGYVGPACRDKGRVGTGTIFRSFMHKIIEAEPPSHKNADNIARTTPAYGANSAISLLVNLSLLLANPTSNRKLNNDIIPMQLLMIGKHIFGFGYLKQDRNNIEPRTTHDSKEPNIPMNRPNFHMLPNRSLEYRKHPPKSSS